MVTQPGKVLVKRDEELGRSDVVIHAHQRLLAVIHQRGRGAPNRKMKEAQGLLVRGLVELRQGKGLVSHPCLNLLREDFRTIPTPAEFFLYGQSLVADGIAEGQGGQNLMYGARLHGFALRLAAAMSFKYFSRITGQA